MKKLIFMTNKSPLNEDERKHYSRIRFYSDTIVKLAESFECSDIFMLHNYTNRKDGVNIINIEEDNVAYLKEFDQDPSKFENCYYLKNLANSKNINCRFMSINNYLSSDYSSTDEDSIVLFGILNSSDKNMDIILSSYEAVIRNSANGYYYLSSDAELSSHQYVTKGRVGFLSKLSSYCKDHVFYSKLKGVILTEITDPNILDSYEKSGIPQDKVFYLPMIINTETRIKPVTPVFSEKNGQVMLLRNFDQWMNYPELLESIKDHFDMYESPMPAIRRKYTPIIVDQYGGYYKTARFWKIDKLKEILGWYSYYMGMSTPGSDRFTYKIIEATDAGTVCLLPIITLKPLGYDQSLSQSILDEYKDLMIFDVESDEKFRLSVTRVKDIIDNYTESEYMHHYNRQKEFVYKYFDYNSDNINSCIKLIKEGK